MAVGNKEDQVYSRHSWVLQPWFSLPLGVLPEQKAELARQAREPSNLLHVILLRGHSPTLSIPKLHTSLSAINKNVSPRVLPGRLLFFGQGEVGDSSQSNG